MDVSRAVLTTIGIFSNHICRDKSKYCTQTLSVTPWFRGLNLRNVSTTLSGKKKKKERYKETFILRIEFLYSDCINELVVLSAGTVLCRLCSVRDCGGCLVEKKCVFLVWSLAWEQPESGHHTTLWQPRADRGGNTHLPARPWYLPGPCGPLTHTYMHAENLLQQQSIRLQIVCDNGSKPGRFTDGANNKDDIFSSVDT